MNKFFFIAITTTLLFFTLSVRAKEIYFGADLGIGLLDVGATQNAKKISDLSNSTVTTDYDSGAGVVRFYTGYNK